MSAWARLLPVALAIAALFLFREPLATHAQVWLLLSEQLPQIPIKPLSALTSKPAHEVVRIETAVGPVVADLFTPAGPRFDLAPGAPRPALMIALGIHQRESDRPSLLSFAETFARLGYVVLWPRGAAIDAGHSTLEEPETFVAGVQYLAGLAPVDPERISIFGISLGASIAMVAASDVRIANQVHGIVAFGSYYSLTDYILSLVTRTAAPTDSTVERGGAAPTPPAAAPWSPSDDALHRTRQVLEGLGYPEVAALLTSTPPVDAAERLRPLAAGPLQQLARFDPSRHLGTLRAKTFILHDQSDPYVPFVESEKLRDALPAHEVGAFLLTDLFQHTAVEGGFSGDTIRGIARLYAFATATLGYF